MKEHVGEKIKRLRTEKGLTQDNVHHNQSQISQIESGRISNPDENTLLIIAKNMDVTFDKLVEDTDWVKPEVVMHNKEIAISPWAWNFEIEDSGIINWSCKVYPRYNENGEENKFCPDTGTRLLIACPDCGRNIANGTQVACMGCGGVLIEPIEIESDVRQILNPISLSTFENIANAMEFIIELEWEYLNKTRDVSWMHKIFKKMFGKDYMDKKDKKMEDEIMVVATSLKAMNEFHLILVKEIRIKLNKMADAMVPKKKFVPRTFEEAQEEISRQTRNEIFFIIKEKVRNAYLDDDTKKLDEAKADLFEFLKVIDSSENPEELLSKLQSGEISKDGNSETDAAKKADRNNSNAKKTKKKEA